MEWDDVVTLGDKSFPSGFTQNWPANAPLTLRTAATLMISISDNTPTDLLIDAIGREVVEAEMRATGHSNPALSLPPLTTVEMFVLKGDDRGAAYAQADEVARRAMLAELVTQGVYPTPVLAVFAGGMPNMIDTVEWFANMEDQRRLMRRLAETKDDTARRIMAVNTALGEGSRASWRYFGFKGGPEPGVRNLSWLLRDDAALAFAGAGLEQSRCRNRHRNAAGHRAADSCAQAVMRILAPPPRLH